MRRRVVEFVEGLSSMILAEDYYVERILRDDWRGNLEFRRETVTANESMVVAATQRRPLQGRPWLYCSMHAVADAAFDDTDCHCVSHQLLTLARRDGEAVWNEAALEAELQRAYEKLYPDPHFDYFCSFYGFTAKEKGTNRTTGVSGNGLWKPKNVRTPHAH